MRRSAADRSAFVRSPAPARTLSRIGHDRILGDLLRKETLGEPRHEDHVEREAARFFDRRDVDAPVRPFARTHHHVGEPPLENEPRLAQIDRADVGHRRQLGQNGEHALGPPERARRERRQLVEPSAPVGGERRGERLEIGEERECIRAQAVERLDVALDARGARLVVEQHLLAIVGQLLPETEEPLSPAIATSDDGGVDEQLLPDARRA